MIINLASLSPAARAWLNSLIPNVPKRSIDDLQIDERLLLAKIENWLAPKNVTAWKKTELAHLIEVANLSLQVAQAVSKEIPRGEAPGSGITSITSFLLQIKPGDHIPYMSSGEANKAAEKVFISALLTYEFEYQRSYAQQFKQVDQSPAVKIAILERNVAQLEYNIAVRKQSIQKETEQERIVMRDSSTMASSSTPREMTLSEVGLLVQNLMIEADEIDLAAEKQKIIVARVALQKSEDASVRQQSDHQPGRVGFVATVVTTGKPKEHQKGLSDDPVSDAKIHLESASKRVNVVRNAVLDIFSPRDGNASSDQQSQDLTIALIHTFLAEADCSLLTIKYHNLTTAHVVIRALLAAHYEQAKYSPRRIPQYIAFAKIHPGVLAWLLDAPTSNQRTVRNDLKTKHLLDLQQGCLTDKDSCTKISRLLLNEQRLSKDLTGAQLVAMLTVEASYGLDRHPDICNNILTRLLGTNHDNSTSVGNVLNALLLFKDASAEHNDDAARQMIVQIGQRILHTSKSLSNFAHNYRTECATQTGLPSAIAAIVGYAGAVNLAQLAQPSTWAKLEAACRTLKESDIAQQADNNNNSAKFSDNLHTPPRNKHLQVPGSGAGLSSAASNTSSAHLDQISPAGSTTSSARHNNAANNDNATPQSAFSNVSGSSSIVRSNVIRGGLFADDSDDDDDFRNNSTSILGSKPGNDMLARLVASEANDNAFGNSSPKNIMVATRSGINSTIPSNNNIDVTDDAVVVNHNNSNGGGSPTFGNKRTD